MMNGINGSGGSLAQMQGMQQRKGQGARFDQLDADKNGTLDQTELQAMTDKMSEMTGQKMSVEEVTETYDANNDGLLAKDEMQSMMMELRDKMGGRGEGQGFQQSIAAYQSDPEKDLTAMLLEMFGEQDEEQEEYSPLNTRV